MSFDNPAVLNFFYIYIILVPILFLRYRKSRVRASLFAAPSADRKKFLGELRLRIIISEFFFLLFIFFLIIALAGPRWGSRIVPDHRRGIDIVMAFDVSQSMNVRDERDSSSRLERAMDIALEFSSSLTDIRLAAALGRGRGILAVPLTYDTETINSFLHGLSVQSFSGRGTNLENLIEAAVEAFRDSVPSRKGIILFSDGEALSGTLLSAVERVRREGIFVSVIALGTEEGGRIPLDEDDDSPPSFLTGNDGEEIISQRYSSVLRQAAERSGGFYIDGSRPDAAQVLTDYIDSLSAESRILGFRREDNPRWQYFIIGAIISFLVMRLLAYGRHKKNPSSSARNDRSRKKFKAVKILSLVFLTGLLSSCTRVQGMLYIMEGNFHSVRGYYSEAISSYLKAMEFERAVPYAEYGLGSVYFAMGETAAALERYYAVERLLEEFVLDDHRELQYRIHYNKGIIYFELEEFEEAALAFREALVMDSARIEAKQNLELSLLSMVGGSGSSGSNLQDLDENENQSITPMQEYNSIIFEYLRDREQEQWRNMEWEAEYDYSGPDY